VNAPEAPKVIEHTACRLCGSSELTPVFSLGTQYVNDFVPQERIGRGVLAPLELVHCGRCTLIQLKHTAPQELLYSRFYWYRSGVTETMRRALRDITAQVESMVSLQPGDVVLDIGANDGTLLASYAVPGIQRVGCEPASNLVEQLRANADHVIHDFWKVEAFDAVRSQNNLPKAKVITAIGMFYDLEEPNTFIRDIQRSLAPGGVFVAQLMCLASMLKKNDLGNICHEHIEYYSLQSLKYLYENNGLEIFRIEENDVNGGSYRVFARHAAGTGMPLDEDVTLADLHAFKARIDRNRELCVNFIQQEVEQGKKVWVYGASTKGNVILQYYGLDTKLIAAAAERSPEKWGKYTVGSWIPIVSEEKARKAQPDYFLVLPWAFFDEMYAREHEWRERGGKFIVPLPEFRVVS
jgi:SAM-dependent methyltransferase